jgi:hypothetical protein
LTGIDARYNKIEEEPLIGIFSVWELVGVAGGFVDTKQNNKLSFSAHHYPASITPACCSVQRQLFFEAADIQSARDERSFQSL